MCVCVCGCRDLHGNYIASLASTDFTGLVKLIKLYVPTVLACVPRADSVAPPGAGWTFGVAVNMDHSAWCPHDASAGRYLTNNRLRRIPSGVFNGLVSLTMLYVSFLR